MFVSICCAECGEGLITRWCYLLFTSVVQIVVNDWSPGGVTVMLRLFPSVVLNVVNE